MSTSKQDLVLFDTTLRDGAQMEGLTLTVDDKLRIAQKIDELGVQYIEGGWPGSNPKDAEFFARAHNELRLKHAKLVTFSSTRRAGTTPGKDANLRITIGAQTPVVCVVGKSWDLHVKEALRTTLDENLKMVGDTMKYLRRHFDEVFFDAEHFFDGFKRNPDYAMRVLEAAAENGADCVVLCDTNGGCLPDEINAIVSQVHETAPAPARHPLPQRHRLCRRQLADRDRRRRGARPGCDQRVRRAVRQREPRVDRGEPRPQEGRPGRDEGAARRAVRDRPLRRRDREPDAEPATAVRRVVRVRAQGRSSCVCGDPPSRSVRAHRAGTRR